MDGHFSKDGDGRSWMVMAFHRRLFWEGRSWTLIFGKDADGWSWTFIEGHSFFVGRSFTLMDAHGRS